MSNTYRKVDTSHEEYIQDKKIKQIDKKHQTLLVTDGTVKTFINDSGDLCDDQKGKKILKKHNAHKNRQNDHRLEKDSDE